MTGLLDSVDQRTQLVGENRLELLMFQLNGSQLYAVNVFKVQEVLSLPKLTLIPHRHPVVCGITHLRGQTIAVIDLSAALGRRPMLKDSSSNVIVAEYNMTVQAFLVGAVERIVNLNWEEILPPPNGAGNDHFLTAITRLDEQIVEIIDLEKVLASVVPAGTAVSPELLDIELIKQSAGSTILLVDDSSVAIQQAKATLGQLGVNIITATNGRNALDLLLKWADAGENVPQKLAMVITDAEMPQMDGYRLTAEIRQDSRLSDLYVVLHTSLSGEFNKSMVKKVGCDDFLSKFQPDRLAEIVQNRLRQVVNGA